MGTFIMLLMFTMAFCLIVLVLLQRGRGGGLAGALGGMGGQSAFGTKAGDMFTRITIYLAAAWICLCAASVKYFTPPTKFDRALGANANADQEGEDIEAAPTSNKKGDTGKSKGSSKAGSKTSSSKGKSGGKSGSGKSGSGKSGTKAEREP